jgi:hypothetical protein
MKSVGGKAIGWLQLKSGTAKNEIGEVVPQFTTLHTLTGWLDYSAGESNRTSYDAKIQESTHIFLCDYFQLDPRITAENSRMIVNGKKYDVLVIDNVMEMNQHFEIYLKYTGA